MSIGEILDDFKSIRLSPARREFVNNSRDIFQRTGGLPISTQDKLRKFYRLYGKQVAELHASRERARATNWRIREGLSVSDVSSIAKRRQREISNRKGDLGI